MRYLKPLLYILLLGVPTIGVAQNLEKQFDKMLNALYLPDEPGATALVAKGGEIVYHKAFGMANLELDVQMKPDMVLEIGSITKQFTAVSILMLMEQGKLNVEDDITAFIEDYPTHGHHISIHHLLTHTSGIKSYTSIERWSTMWRQDLEPMEVIDIFKNEPMDFAPGEAWSYNNSAYILLGYIIEKASGLTYEEFVETNIFEPLGMHSSRYGKHSEVIKKRASGYHENSEFVNAEYLSLTQPYAAGSLMSTVEDLYIWNRAIRSNKLVKPASIALAFTNYTLNNGEHIDYGYGWAINEINGSATVEHSGGIFGFVTNSIYLPDEDVFVAIYSNCDCNGPGEVSTKMAAMAIGKPYLGEDDAITVEEEYLKRLVGVYDFADNSSRIITLEGDQLYSQRVGSTKIKLFPTQKNTFSFEDHFATIAFEENGDRIKAIFSSRIDKTEGSKTNKPIPSTTEIQLGLDILERYVGVYEIQPGFDLTVTLEDGKLMSQATGQQNVQIFPESETKFFLKVLDAQIEFFANEEGSFESFILYQGGQEIPGKKKH